jgi:pimeloyl-ACP methyl ester carboxylesterase
LLPRLKGLRVPALFVTGALDERYSQLAQEMQRGLGPAEQGGLPYAEVHILGGAGHTVHLEKPDAWGRLVRDFLEKHRPEDQP